MFLVLNNPLSVRAQYERALLKESSVPGHLARFEEQDLLTE